MFSLPKIIKKQSNLYIRYKPIVYISSCNSLRFLKNNYNYTKQINDIYLNEIESILRRENILIDSKLSNNILHYTIEKILINNKKNNNIFIQILLNENIVV